MAAFQLSSPAWLARTLQLPTLWKVIVPEVFEQTADEAASMVKTTFPPLVEVPLGE